MGPQRASEIYLQHHRDARAFRVTLFGSLAATGRGHMTDVAIKDVLEKQGPVEIVWHPDVFLDFHPNGMRFEVLDDDKAEKSSDDGRASSPWTVYSIGGGALSEGNDPKGYVKVPKDIYPMTHLSDIQNWCETYGYTYWEYVQQWEDDDIWDFLREIWQAMKQSVERGISHEGRLPGPLNLQRKAQDYYVKARMFSRSFNPGAFVYAYSLAVSEENASGGTIVTAPTCGASGVMPGVLYHLWKKDDFSEQRILHALATAGLVGNIVKENASISGAEVGCQGEVGVACAMAAAAACQLAGGSPAQIEYAAEMGLEHHLGMTCDPVCGLVQIPCIERNAFAAKRALDASIYASFGDGKHRVSFDKVVAVMNQTGHDIPSLYKETSEGGLASSWTETNDPLPSSPDNRRNKK